MKKFLLSCLFVLLCSGAAFATQPPRLLYTDLTSGPKTGGENNWGVYVTLFGKYFTTSTGTVTLGGVPVATIRSWSDEKVVVQLGPSVPDGASNFIVTAGGVASNTLPFYVRTGRIRFWDPTVSVSGDGSVNSPWKNFSSWTSSITVGDTLYVKGGTAGYVDIRTNQIGDASKFIMGFYSTSLPEGTLNNEIAIVAYPGHEIILDSEDNGALVTSLCMDRGYWVAANFKIKSYACNPHAGRGGTGSVLLRGSTGHCRLVNLDIKGMTYPAQTYWDTDPGAVAYGSLWVQSSTNTIYGCNFYGARVANKLDHCVYFQNGTDGNDVGWCKFWDNWMAQGPVVSANNDSDGTTDFLNNSVHDCHIDCRGSKDQEDGFNACPLRAIYWAGVGVNSSGKIYNNVIIEGGENRGNQSGGFWMSKGNFEVYNNTFYRCYGTQYNNYTIKVEAGNIVLRNNIFYNQSSGYYVEIAAGATATISDNLYYGGQGSLPADSDPLSQNPRFEDAASYDLHLTTYSPCISRGYTLPSYITHDYDSVPRPTGEVDIGAYEALPEDSPTPPTYYNISGYIKDATGAGISGASVALTGSDTKSYTTITDGYYAFSNLVTGNYTVTPTKTDWTFDPVNRSSYSLSGSLMNYNFAGSSVPYTPGEGTMRVKVSGVEVNTIYVGQTAEVEFSGIGTGTYRFRVYGSDGLIKYDSDLYNVQNSTFSWTPTEPTGKYFPVIKGAGNMFEYKAIDIQTPGE